MGVYTAALTCLSLSSWSYGAQSISLVLLDTIIARTEFSGVFGMQDRCTPGELSGLVRLDNSYFRAGSFPISHAHLMLHRISRRRARKTKERQHIMHQMQGDWLWTHWSRFEDDKANDFQANSILKNLVFLLLEFWTRDVILLQPICLVAFEKRLRQQFQLSSTICSKKEGNTYCDIF